jgi:hypothetical protein
MMAALKAHWITALATLGVLFLWFIGIAFIADPDDGRQTVDVVFGTMFGLVGVGLLAGLWGLHTGRLPLWVAHTLIVVGAIAVGAFFWLFLVPLAIALPVLYFGVIRIGLERELRPS